MSSGLAVARGCNLLCHAGERCAQKGPPFLFVTGRRRARSSFPCPPRFLSMETPFPHQRRLALPLQTLRGKRIRVYVQFTAAWSLPSSNLVNRLAPLLLRDRCATCVVVGCPPFFDVHPPFLVGTFFPQPAQRSSFNFPSDRRFFTP